MRVFLSYHSTEQSIASSLMSAIEARDSAIKIFFAPYSLRGGAIWLPRLGQEIAEADAFLLLLGSGVGEWQKFEYYEALDRRAQDPSFPIVPVVTGMSAPGLPFLRQLHWISTSTPQADPQLSTIVQALKGEGLAEIVRPWRTTNPYRGLLALREEDAAYFFGREAKTAEILTSIEKRRGKLIALIGNSGVGKSSLVQAGVIGALKRQRWPQSSGSSSAAESWPTSLKSSRSWVYLTTRVGENPVRALASAFTNLWFHERGDPRRIDWIDGWEARLSAKGNLVDLLDETQGRFSDAKVEPPHRIVVYLDQAEELYASRLPRQLADRFSNVLARGLEDPRLLVLASQRSDYYGHLQANSALFPATERIDVPPLDAAALTSVLSEPARVLRAAFESDGLVNLLVDAAKDQPGALPLLADHMSELWSRMQARDDGVIRVADRSEVIRISAALANRADRFLLENATDLPAVRRLFCLKLTHVPREGEPVRRRALRSDCSVLEWQLIERMAQEEWRLLVTGEVEGLAQAEIAHEVLLREWPALRDWLADEREFLAWKGEIEHASRQAALLSRSRRAASLLMGRPLAQAKDWLALRPHDIGDAERTFIQESLRNRKHQGRALGLLVALLFLSVIVQPLGTLYFSQFRAGLIEAAIQSLLVQGEMIAGVVAASATVESDSIQIDPERLLDLQAGESYGPSEEALSGLEFPINPERTAPVLRRLVSPRNTRARIYDRDGVIIIDTRNLYDILRRDLPPTEGPGLLERGYFALRPWFSRGTLPLYHEFGPENGKSYSEVANAVQGFKSSMVRLNERGEVIVSVAVPVQRFRAVRGAVMMSTQGADIDNLVAADRLALLRMLAFALLMGLLTVWLAFRAMRGVVGR